MDQDLIVLGTVATEQKDNPCPQRIYNLSIRQETDRWIHRQSDGGVQDSERLWSQPPQPNCCKVFVGIMAEQGLKKD